MGKRAPQSMHVKLPGCQKDVRLIRCEPSFVTAAAKTTLKSGNDLRNVVCHRLNMKLNMNNKSENLGESGKNCQGGDGFGKLP
jgi:hypothetical protein